jgi:hypothetical protein
MPELLTGKLGIVSC